MKIFLREFDASKMEVISRQGAEGLIHGTSNYIIKRISANKANTETEMNRLYKLHKKLMNLNHPHIADILDIKVYYDDDNKLKTIEIWKERLEKLNPEEHFHAKNFMHYLMKWNVRFDIKLLKNQEIKDKILNRINNVDNEQIKQQMLGLLDASEFILKNGFEKLFYYDDESKAHVYDLHIFNVMKDKNDVWKIIDF